MPVRDATILLPGFVNSGDLRRCSRATETEALAERVFLQRQERWGALARQLKRVEGEIEKRGLDCPARLGGLTRERTAGR